MAPRDAGVQKALAELRASAGERLVERHAKKAALEERPDDGEARARLANALARATRP